jgi:hypothetical protein
MSKWSAALVASFVAATMLFSAGVAIAAAPTGNHLSGVSFAPVSPLGSSTTSGNWAGYAVTGPTGSVTKVSANWVEPAVKCGAATSFAAFWVGIDGFSSKTVEQTGTIAECVGGAASYYVWWEMYPTNSVQVYTTISPGDHFSAYVAFNGGSSFTMSITDTTTSTTWTTTSSQTATEESAEWIAEAPCCVSSGATYPLSNFGHVTFSSAMATVSGSTHGIGKFSTHISITMVTSKGKDRAVPSTLTNNTAFKVTWKHS